VHVGHEIVGVRRQVSSRYRALPGWQSLLLRFVVVLTALAIVGGMTNSYQQSVIATALIYGVAAMALTVLMGWVGRPSIMTASNLLAGQYVAVFLANELKLNFLLVLVLSLVAGGIFGAVAALPARRLEGLYLLLSTLAFYYIVTNLGNVLQSKQGALGGYYVDTPTVFGAAMETPMSWVWIAGIVVIIVFEYFRYLRSTRVGRAWIMIRDTEDAAGLAGVRLPSYVATAFVISTAVQFLAGALLAYQIGSVSYNSVSLLLSVNFIVMIVLGRMGSLGGAVLGALIVSAVPVFMNSWFGSSASTGWLSENLVAVESVLFALIGVVVLLGVPRRIARWVRAGGLRRVRPAGPHVGGQSSVPATVSVSDVSVQYGAGEHAISHASLDLPMGGVVALLGRNGAGKSSLLYAIAGFPPGTQGRVVDGQVWLRSEGSDGVDISSEGIIERNRLGIVLVPAEDKVFVDLTVREHLREAIAAGGKRRQAAGRPPMAQDELLSHFPNLDAKFERAGGNLSGGERQQLAMAMAVARDAQILLIDEATLGLAPVAIRAIEPVLRELGSQAGRSLVLAEQNPQLAMRVAGTVVLLDAGEIVRQGSADPSFLELIEQNYLGLAPVEDAVGGGKLPEGDH
jgi:branched-chain amino acid transport system permease protein